MISTENVRDVLEAAQAFIGTNGRGSSAVALAAFLVVLTGCTSGDSAASEGGASSATATSGTLVAAEAETLLQIASSNQQWVEQLSWDLDADPCTWTGIVCSDDEVVTISLADSELTGEVPAELAELTNLQQLGLGGNRLTGEIPVELADLADLEGLALNGNRLTGGVPIELAELTNLQQLGLGGNRLTGEIPVELASLTNLQQLGLGGNRLTGEIPVELAELSDLSLIHI